MRFTMSSFNAFASSRWGYASLGLFLALNVLLSVSSAWKKSVTVDEFAILPTGLAILQEKAFHIDRGVPPLPKVLTALPAAAMGPVDFRTDPIDGLTSSWSLGRRLAEQAGSEYHTMFLWGRAMSLAVLLLTCVLTILLARRLYGPGGGWLAGAVVSLSPNLIAHGRLVTTDIYLSAAVVAVLLMFDRFLLDPGRRSIVGLGGVLGLAVLSKFTGLLLFFVLPLAWVAWVYLPSAPSVEEPKRELRWKGMLLRYVAAVIVACAVINAGYLAQGFGTPLAAYSFSSSVGQGLQSFLPGWLPVPLPVDFVKGCDVQLAERGYQAYLLGEFRESGFWNYYLVGFLVKTPVAILLLALLATALKVKPDKREVPLLVVGIGTFLFFSFASHKNIGIRYLLFLIPLVSIWIGRLSILEERRWELRIGSRLTVLSVALGSLIFSAVSTWPDYIPYFNLASGGPSEGHRYLLDSNLDWGQDLVALGRFMDEEGIDRVGLAHFGRVPPEVYGIRYDNIGEGSGHRFVAVSANLLWGRMYVVNGTDLWPRDQNAFAGLRTLRPYAVLGHSLYVYDLSPQEGT